MVAWLVADYAKMSGSMSMVSTASSVISVVGGHVEVGDERMSSRRRARAGSSVRLNGPTPPYKSRVVAEVRSHIVSLQKALNVSGGGCIFDRFHRADASFGR